MKENRKTQTTCLGPGQKCTCSTDNHQILLRWEPLYVYVDIELESVASSINVIIHQNQVYYQRHSYVKPYLTDKRQRKDRENMRCIQISIYMVTERGACPCHTCRRVSRPGARQSQSAKNGTNLVGAGAGAGAERAPSPPLSPLSRCGGVGVCIHFRLALFRWQVDPAVGELDALARPPALRLLAHRTRRLSRGASPAPVSRAPSLIASSSGAAAGQVKTAFAAAEPRALTDAARRSASAATSAIRGLTREAAACEGAERGKRHTRARREGRGAMEA